MAGLPFPLPSGLPTGEEIDAGGDQNITITDSIGVTDATSREHLAERIITETVGVTDVTVDDFTTTDLTETVTDTVGVTDQTSRIHVVERIVVDDVDVTDAANDALLDTSHIRPNSDEDVGDWEDEGAGTTDIYQSVWGAAQNDSTYIEVGSSSGVSQKKIYFGTNTVSDPLNDNGHIVRIRAQKFGSFSSNITSRVNVYFYEGFVSEASPGTLIYFAEMISSFGGPGSDALNTAWTTHEIKLPAWAYNSISDWADITMCVEGLYSGIGGSGQRGIRVAWIEHFVPDALGANTESWEYSLAPPTAHTGTSFTELLRVPASRLKGSTDYLLIAQGTGGTDDEDGSLAQLVVQEDDSGWSTITNLGPSNNLGPNFSRSPQEPSFFADIYTTPATPIDIRLAGRSNDASNESRFDDLGLTLIDLSALTVNVDYFIEKNTTGVGANSGTFNNLVTKTLDVTSDDVWLFVGNIHYELSSTSPSQIPDFRLTMYDDSVVHTSQGDIIQTLHNWGMIEAHTVVATGSKTAKIDVARLSGSGTNATVYGQLIGLRLDAFPSFEAVTGTSSASGITNEWRDGKALSSFSPASGSNMLLIGGARLLEGIETDGMLRMQVNGFDVVAPTEAFRQAPRNALPQNIGTLNRNYASDLNTNEALQVAMAWAGVASGTATIEYNSRTGNSGGAFQNFSIIAIELGLPPITITEPVGITDLVAQAGARSVTDPVGVTDSIVTDFSGAGAGDFGESWGIIPI